jgi:hypothetical protein
MISLKCYILYLIHGYISHIFTYRVYFMEERELQWANPSIKFPLPEVLTRALAYLFRILFSSKDPTHWLSLCRKPAQPRGPDYTIAPHWRRTKTGAPSKTNPASPLAIDNATKQVSIERSLSQRAAAHANANGANHTRVLLSFPAKGKTWALRHQACTKRGRATTIEPLRGSDAPGDKASI